LLVERVHERRRKMRNGDATSLLEVFVDIEARRWSLAKIWGELSGRPSRKPWTSETIEKRYYEAMGRLEEDSRERRMLEAERLRLSAK
jgi:acetoin utilization deacetylase AcuC-like enzyme